MSPTKQSPDAPVEGDTPVDQDAAKSPALDKVALAKQRYQPRFPDPRASYKGKKIGNAPRGTRRSMGKR